MKKHILIIFAISFIALSCGTRIKYLGNSYPATAHVDVYFSEKDVEKDYTVIGHADAAPFFNSIKAAQQSLTKEARKRGADGIIFKDVNSTLVTVNNTVSEQVNVHATFLKYKQ